MHSVDQALVHEGSTLAYDGSFPGFLCCIYTVFKLQLQQVEIQRLDRLQTGLFSVPAKIETDEEQAAKVLNRLEKRLGKPAAGQVYRAFLSESEGIENVLTRYIRHGLSIQKPVHLDYSQPDVLSVSQIVKKVNREKHRMEAFVRFRLTRDNLFFAQIAPDFDVLPLINRHFTERYADQCWLIYDEKRDYGLHYDLRKTTAVMLDIPKEVQMLKDSEALFTTEEKQYQALWKDYFQSTNIKSRKNDKLHLQHVPRRYWRYLTEKLI